MPVNGRSLIDDNTILQFIFLELLYNRDYRNSEKQKSCFIFCIAFKYKYQREFTRAVESWRIEVRLRKALNLQRQPCFKKLINIVLYNFYTIK